MSPRTRLRKKIRNPRLPNVKPLSAIEHLENRYLLTTVTTHLDVTNPNDGLVSLREAVNLTHTNPEFDYINFDSSLAGQTIQLVVHLRILSDLTIDAGNLAGGLTLRGGASHVFLADDLRSTDEDFDVTLVGLNITGGAVDRDGGGGIYFDSSGTLTLIRSSVTENTDTSSLGIGGVRVKRGNLRMLDSTVSDNFGAGVSAEGNVTITNSNINHNMGPGVDGDVVTIFDSNISHNIGNGVSGERLTIESSEIFGNEDIGVDGGTATLSRTSVNENGRGVTGSQVTLIETTVSDNRGDRYSRTGGVAGGEVTIIKSTVSQNVAGGVSGSSVVLTGSTISGNLGTGVSGRSVRIIDSTITENVVAFAEDDAGVRGTNVHIENSIIARNEGAISQLHSVDLFVYSAVEVRNSLIGTNRGSQLTPSSFGLPDNNGNLIGTLIQPIDPALGPLADNGGPTLTHEPLPGSPVIDRGKSVVGLDQRGFERSVNIFPAPNDLRVFDDMGAVERQAVPSSWLPSDVSAIADTTSNLNLSQTLVSNDSGNPVTLTLTASRGQFEPPASGPNVDAILVNPTTLSLTGLPLDINLHFDTTNIQFTPQAGDIGNDVAQLTAFLDDGTVITELGEVNIDVEEPRSNMIVTTSSDELDRFDGDTSLREALLAAYLFEGTERITFEDELSGQSIFVSRPLDIVDSVTIDATALSEMLTIDGQQTSQLFLADTALGTTLGNDLDVTIAGLRLVNGHSSEPGGAIGIFDFSSTLTLNSSVIDENQSDERGGGIYSVGEVVISDSVVSRNRGRYGGGIWVMGMATLSNNLLIDNVAFDDGCFCAGGGGISARYGAVITNSTISGNTSIRKGGGILAEYGEVILQGSTVSQNRTSNYGGGISADTLIVTNSTISNNEVTNGSGGGVRASHSYLTNSTVSGNSATRRGGGISGGSVSLAHSTITNNSAGMIGGGFIVDNVQPATFVDDSIVYGNTADSDSDISFRSSAEINYSVIGPTDLTIIGTGNLIGVSPVLLPLVDNGGPTHTHALAPDSPAINAGNPTPALPPEYDQRGPGFARLSGGRIDIGAIEFQEPRGDFNEDGVYDCLDIDGLTNVLAMGLVDLRYDVTNDGVLDSADVEAWLVEAGSSLFGPGVSLIPGDADLNGTVDVSDWNIWNNNKFTMNSAWCSGNFNADTVIEVSDFNVWNENKFRSVSNPDRQVDDEQLPVMSPDRIGLLSSQFAAHAVLYPGWHRLPFSNRVQWDAQHSRTRTLDMIFGDTPESQRGVGETAWYRRIGFDD